MADPDRLILLDESEAQLLLHVFAAFERLLRQGRLEAFQQRLLLPDGLAQRGDAADVEMAEVVVDAIGPLVRQL